MIQKIITDVPYDAISAKIGWELIYAEGGLELILLATVFFWALSLVIFQKLFNRVPGGHDSKNHCCT